MLELFDEALPFIVLMIGAGILALGYKLLETIGSVLARQRDRAPTSLGGRMSGLVVRGATSVRDALAILLALGILLLIGFVLWKIGVAAVDATPSVLRALGEALHDPWIVVLLEVLAVGAILLALVRRTASQRIAKRINSLVTWSIAISICAIFLRLWIQPSEDVLTRHVPHIHNVDPQDFSGRARASSDWGERTRYCSARHLAQELFGGYGTAPIRILRGTFHGSAVKMLLLTGTELAFPIKESRDPQATLLVEDFASKFGLANRYSDAVDSLAGGNDPSLVGPTDHVVVVGHSLGAMAAVRFADERRRLGHPVEALIAFGQPRIWNPMLYSANANVIHQITLHEDVISSVGAWVDWRWILRRKSTPFLILRDGVVSHLAYTWDWRMQTRDVLGNALLVDMSPSERWWREAFDIPSDSAFSAGLASNTRNCITMDFQSERDFSVLAWGANEPVRLDENLIRAERYVPYVPLTRDSYEHPHLLDIQENLAGGSTSQAKPIDGEPAVYSADSAGAEGRASRVAASAGGVDGSALSIGAENSFVPAPVTGRQVIASSVDELGSCRLCLDALRRGIARTSVSSLGFTIKRIFIAIVQFFEKALVRRL